MRKTELSQEGLMGAMIALERGMEDQQWPPTEMSMRALSILAAHYGWRKTQPDGENFTHGDFIQELERELRPWLERIGELAEKLPLFFQPIKPEPRGVAEKRVLKAIFGDRIPGRRGASRKRSARRSRRK